MKKKKSKVCTVSLQCSVPSHDFFLNVWSDIVSDLRHRSCEGIRWLRWHAAICRIRRHWAAHTEGNVIVLSGFKNPLKNQNQLNNWPNNYPKFCSYNSPKNRPKTTSGQKLFRTYGIEVVKESDGSGGTLPSAGSEGSESCTLKVVYNMNKTFLKSTF